MQGCCIDKRGNAVQEDAREADDRQERAKPRADHQELIHARSQQLIIDAREADDHQELHARRIKRTGQQKGIEGGQARERGEANDLDA